MLFRAAFYAVAAAPLLLAFAAEAQTTDPNWTGPYIGIHGGATLDNSDVGLRGLTAGNSNALTTNARPSNTIVGRNGGEGGGQIGYNYQMGRFVGGLEADIALTGADGSTSVLGSSPTGPNGRTYVSSKLDDLGTVRARFGYLVTPRVLFYGTGGYAYGDVKYRADMANASGALAYTGSDSYTAGGYTYGAGVEYAYPIAFNVLGRRSAMTLRAEYLHYDLGKKEVNVGAVGGVGTGGYVGNFKTIGDEVRGAVNFKF